MRWGPTSLRFGRSKGKGLRQVFRTIAIDHRLANVIFVIFVDPTSYRVIVKRTETIFQKTEPTGSSKPNSVIRMTSSNKPASILRHSDIAPAKIGVMLVNLGTPNAADPSSVKRYLGEFLSDRRVIELNPWLWKPVLYGIILPLRSKRVAEAYRKIWHHDTDESPLRLYSRLQADRVGEALQQRRNQDINVVWAMRYGNPSIPDTLNGLRKQGCRHILVVPLYPQYSATTTATVTDKVFETLQSVRYQPAVRILPPYHDQPKYIHALALSVEDYLENTVGHPEVLIVSFHGLPKACIEAGDPYYCHCAKTIRLLRERLGVDENFLRLTFQSRFGPKQWLQPYTSETLTDLANSGIRHVAVLTPGFAADCLETLEEIGMQNRDLFLAQGGERFDYIPCLNDSPPGIEMLTDLIEEELSGWI